MEEGNFGDVRSVGEGVIERRANFGPGYRIYFAWDGSDLVILIGGGDKSDQRNDIIRARERWRDQDTESAREFMMPLSEDWKIGARRMIRRDPELRAGTVQDVLELLASDDDEDQRVARRMARGLLELEFETDAELLELLKQPISA